MNPTSTGTHQQQIARWSSRVFDAGWVANHDGNLSLRAPDDVRFIATPTAMSKHDIQAHDVVTVEGGLGWSFLGGAGMFGVAYFAHWKVTDDDLWGLDLELPIELPIEIPIGRNRVFGVGPELQLPIATKKKLIALVGVRYLWDVGARTSLEGSTLVVTATFPIPSVPLE